MRCIKPNLSQRCDLFDENIVLPQLISSGSIAYQKLIKTGFPTNMSIEDLFNKFQSNGDFHEHTCINQKEFCSRLLRACYLKRKDFEIGNAKIFFRTGKIEILAEKLKSDPKEILFRLNKLKLLRSKLNFAILVAKVAARYLSIGKSLRKSSQTDAELCVEYATKHPGEIQLSECKIGKRKKMKFDTQPVQHYSSSKLGIIGIFLSLFFNKI